MPYPFAVDDHQSANARFLREAGAALVVRNDELDGARLTALLEQFIVAGQVNREPLIAMACAARRQARVDAAEQAARICIEVAAGAAACHGCRSRESSSS